jgi:hypothetical protein
MRTRQRQPTPPELIAIRRESWQYTCKKPHRAPPADSPNRPFLAHLWWAAHRAIQRNPRQRTFTLWGIRFGVVFVGERLGVLDIRERRVLVLSPASIAALASIVNPEAVQRG